MTKYQINKACNAFLAYLRQNYPLPEGTTIKLRLREVPKFKFTNGEPATGQVAVYLTKKHAQIDLAIGRKGDRFWIYQIFATLAHEFKHVLQALVEGKNIVAPDPSCQTENEAHRFNREVTPIYYEEVYKAP